MNIETVVYDFRPLMEAELWDPFAIQNIDVIDRKKKKIN